MSNDLVAFLRARLDEDAEAARDATEGPWFAEHPEERWGEQKDTQLIGRGKILTTLPYEKNGHLNVDHIARHDPARVLAEVEAKRRIIALHNAEPGQHPDFCWHDKHELPCPTLRLLALPFANHPDYREEWRP